MPTPYLHFQGRCAEALTFYAEVFGAPPPCSCAMPTAPTRPRRGVARPMSCMGMSICPTAR